MLSGRPGLVGQAGGGKARTAVVPGDEAAVHTSPDESVLKAAKVALVVPTVAVRTQRRVLPRRPALEG